MIGRPAMADATNPAKNGRDPIASKQKGCDASIPRDGSVWINSPAADKLRRVATNCGLGFSSEKLFSTADLLGEGVVE
jgi:hypothetical protein